MDSSPNSQALPAGTRLEEFLIERVLGAGGFGITYLATDTALGRQVVIKENLPVQFAWRDPNSFTVAPRHSHGEDADNFAWSLENFSKEAAMLASLDHPGIVRVHRSFRAFGTAYFVMPFVGGEPLDALIRKRADKGKSFDADEITGLLEHVLDALSYLHDRGIYHRDIKPGNLLITDTGTPVLIDFGSARQKLSERSMTVVESPGYTPFEQLQSRGNVGPWSDLYALGATVARATTSETLPKANDRAFDDPWVPLVDRLEIVAHLPAALLSSIDKAVQPRAQDRWQDGREWMAALDGQGVAQQAPSSPLPSRSEPPAVETTSIPAPPHVSRSPEETGPRKKPVRTLAIAAVLLLGAFVMAGLLMSGGGHSFPQPKNVIIGAGGASLGSGKTGDGLRFQIGGGEEVVVRYVPGGRFQMGSPPGEVNRENNENQVWVTLSSHFWMGETEVTQGQWVAVMGNNPSHFKGGDWNKLPVENVSWNDAQGFIKKLNAESPPGTGWKWALPTEAQWERACRGGTTTATAFGNSLSSHQANFNGKYPYGGAGMGPYLERTTPVKSYQPNGYGLYDMHGNVWEWCVDAYQEEALPGGVDPLVSAGSLRVFRGGGLGSFGEGCRSAFRFWTAPADQSQRGGFRLAAVSVGRAQVAVEREAPVEQGEGIVEDERKASEEAERQAQTATSSLANGKIGDDFKFLIGDGEEVVVKYVPGGRFHMGSPPDEEGRSNNEDQVWVMLSSHYWMAETEVTQGQWMAVMGSNPSHFRGEDWEKLPVESVSWNGAQEYIKKLNAKSAPGAGWKWALPTEAQWERACRGGTTTATAFGNSLSSRHANFNGDYPYGGAAKGPYLRKTVPVKSYDSNAYGLYDMHGNVWEWCADAYQHTLPGGLDPLVSAGSARVIRGGSWSSSGGGCRSSARLRVTPVGRFQNFGFRLAAVPAGRAAIEREPHLEEAERIAGQEKERAEAARQNRPHRIWVPIPLNEELTPPQHQQFATSMHEKLASDEVLGRISMEIDLRTLVGLESEEVSIDDLRGRLICEVGQHNDVPSLNIGFQGIVSEDATLRELTEKIMAEVQKIIQSSTSSESR